MKTIRILAGLMSLGVATGGLFVIMESPLRGAEPPQAVFNLFILGMSAIPSILYLLLIKTKAWTLVLGGLLIAVPLFFYISVSLSEHSTASIGLLVSIGLTTGATVIGILMDKQRREQDSFS